VLLGVPGSLGTSMPFPPLMVKTGPPKRMCWRTPRYQQPLVEVVQPPPATPQESGGIVNGSKNNFALQFVPPRHATRQQPRWNRAFPARPQRQSDLTTLLERRNVALIKENNALKARVQKLEMEATSYKAAAAAAAAVAAAAITEAAEAEAAAAASKQADKLKEASAKASRTAEHMLCIQTLVAADGDNSAKEELMKHQRDCVMLQSDMSGFTRLTKAYGILHFLGLVQTCRAIFKKHLAKHNGKVVKYDGDNVIASFATSLDAVHGVRAIHHEIEMYNEGKEKDFQVRIKLGMSHGLMLIIGNDISGEAWEDCCTLGEDTAEVGEVLVTESVWDDLTHAPADEMHSFDFEARTTEPELDDEGKVVVDGKSLKHFNLTFKNAWQTHNEVNEHVMEYSHSDGCSLIMILHIESEDLDTEVLGAYMYIRAALDDRVFCVLPVGTRVRHKKRGLGTVDEAMPDGRTPVDFDNGERHRYRQRSMYKLEVLTAGSDAVSLIKYDDQRIFAYCLRPEDALRAALKTQLIINSINGRFKKLGNVSVSIGIEHGSMLLQPHDYFGDPVNVASKLGEDTAKGGDLFVSNKVAAMLSTSDECKATWDALNADQRSVTVSHVTIDYANLTIKPDAVLATMLPGFVMPTDADIHKAIDGSAV